MRAWLLLISPFLIWGVHFGGVYAIASVFDVVAAADDPAARWTTAGFSLACLAAAAGVGVVTARGIAGQATEAGRWMFTLAALGSALTALSVVWQALPALIGH